MIELLKVCSGCAKEFKQLATSDIEIKNLQRTIWTEDQCYECRHRNYNYWDE